MAVKLTKTHLGSYQIVGTGYVVDQLEDKTWAAFLPIDVDDLASGSYWSSHYHKTRRDAVSSALWHKRNPEKNQ